jgi:ABC-2 type transport system permease protein
MKGLYAIYRKEMGHYFVSPIAYIVVGVFLFVSGFFFVNIFAFLVKQAFDTGMSQYGGGIDVPSLLIRDFFGVLSSLFLFVTPMLTMGVYAEERKRGTMELLMTSPVTDTQIVLGKYLALLTLFVIMLLPTLICAGVVVAHSDPAMPWRILFCAYLGALLLGGVLLAIGSFFSSVTENQLIAAVLTFGAVLILWVIDFGTRGAGSGIGAVVQYLSVIKHYDDFTRGIIDTSSLTYYISFIFLGLFLTARSLDSMRWRRA